MGQIDLNIILLAIPLMTSLDPLRGECCERLNFGSSLAFVNFYNSRRNLVTEASEVLVRDLLDWFYSDVEIKEWAVIIRVDLWCDDCDDVRLLSRLHDCGELLVRGALCQRLRFIFFLLDNDLS